MLPFMLAQPHRFAGERCADVVERQRDIELSARRCQRRRLDECFIGQRRIRNAIAVAVGRQPYRPAGTTSPGTQRPAEAEEVATSRRSSRFRPGPRLSVALRHEDRKWTQLSTLAPANLAGGVVAPPCNPFAVSAAACVSPAAIKRVCSSPRTGVAVKPVAVFTETELSVTIPSPRVNLPAIAERERKMHARRDALHPLRHIDVHRQRRVSAPFVSELSVVVAAPCQDRAVRREGQ